MPKREGWHLVTPPLPLQMDDWSCGHRCVLASRWAVENQARQTSPESYFTEACIQGLCFKETPKKRPCAEAWLTPDTKKSKRPKDAKVRASRPSCAGETRQQIALGHAEFQRAHWQERLPQPQGHWAKFLAHAHLPCRACAKLQSRLREESHAKRACGSTTTHAPSPGDSSQGHPAIVGLSDGDDKEPAQSCRKHRRSQSLHDWLAENRPTQYTATSSFALCVCFCRCI